jgi:hypothetical protein
MKIQVIGVSPLGNVSGIQTPYICGSAISYVLCMMEKEKCGKNSHFYKSLG